MQAFAAVRITRGGFADTDHMKKKWKTYGTGALAGFINGFFGMGGGIVALFALQKQVDDKRKANATCLAIILPMAVVSLIVYAFSSSVDYALSFKVVLGAVLGAVAGAKLLAKAKYEWILYGYTALMVFSGMMMIFRKG